MAAGVTESPERYNTLCPAFVCHAGVVDGWSSSGCRQSRASLPSGFLSVFTSHACRAQASQALNLPKRRADVSFMCRRVSPNHQSDTTLFAQPSSAMREWSTRKLHPLCLSVPSPSCANHRQVICLLLSARASGKLLGLISKRCPAP